MLAARVGDMHVCPMQTPIGVGTIPHVGGPILPPGVVNVLIGGMPAAIQSNMCMCVGPPDAIIMGAQNVRIAGMAAARLGDSTAHGGSIVSGCPTVIIGSGLSNIDVGALMSQAQSAISQVAAGVQSAANDIASGLNDLNSQMDDLLNNPNATQAQIDALQADIDTAQSLADQV